jgi:hypothetical protein
MRGNASVRAPAGNIREFLRALLGKGAEVVLS